MIGIYKIENIINGHVYIGQSVNIQSRWAVHRSTAYNPNMPLYDSKLYKAIRKYGLKNFIFSVECEIKKEDYSIQYLNNLEKEFIEKYNSYQNGYNATPGGEFGVPQKGEINGNSKLVASDVYNIREMYAAKIPHREAFELYKNKISYSGFTKIWVGNNWKHIHMDVYSDENKLFHKTEAKKLNRNKVHNSKLTEIEVAEVQKKRKQGHRISEVYKDYKDKITMSGFENIWYK